MAIWNGHFEIIQSLLDGGASFQEECTIFGMDTVLEAAILSENTGLVYRVVAAHEGLVNGQALCAAVFLAKETGNHAILSYLLTYNSQLLASEDDWVGTAMCLAAHLGCMNIPELMLSSGLHPETSWPLRRYLYLLEGKSSIRRYLDWRRSQTMHVHNLGQQNCRHRPIFDVAVSLALSVSFTPGRQTWTTSRPCMT